MYPTTRDFVAALDRAGELQRTSARTSPILEITELADRQSKLPAPSLPAEATRRTDPRFHHLGGKALLFENVEGSDIPVVINQFGSYARMEMALGVRRPSEPAPRSGTPAPARRAGMPDGLESLATRLATLIKPEPPPTLIAKLKKLPELLELARVPPKRVRTGLCQEVVATGKDVDLTRLPLLRCWPLDGDFAALGYPPHLNDHLKNLDRRADWEQWGGRGRYITLGGIHTIHADDRDHPAPPSRNIGMYRVQLFGTRHMAMHWHVHHDGARHWRSWKQLGERMPVAIALGGESVLPYAATAPMPPGISELLLAGFLNKGGIPLVRCKTVPLDVPANSEIVIEGWVDVGSGIGDRGSPRAGAELSASQSAIRDPKSAMVFEGPFGDHTGFYSLPDYYPLLEVTAITHRRDPIYPTTVVGLPPQEDYFMGKATERLFLPLLRTIIPDILDYDLPMFGAFHNCAFIQIRKEYPLQARRVMHAVWGAGQMAWTKAIVVVDEAVDVHDTLAVMRAVGERCEHNHGRDLSRVDGPLDILDHAAPYHGAGGKIGFDATLKIPGEEGAFASTSRARSKRPVSLDVSESPPISENAPHLPNLPHARAISIPSSLNHRWAFVSLDVPTDAAVDEVAAALAASPPQSLRYAILFGPDVNPVGEGGDIDLALFHWCANFDPRRDFLHASPDAQVLIFDATPKSPGRSRNGLPCREWPPILTMTEDVVRRIDARAHGPVAAP